MRQLVAVITDTHCTHKVGLCNPNTLILDSDGPTKHRIAQETTQKYLWSHYIEDIEAVHRWASNDEVVIIHAGDWMHGDKYPAQLMTLQPSDQHEIAMLIMEPWFSAIDRIKAVRITEGTDAHDPTGSKSIEATRLLAALYPNRDIDVTIHTLLTLDGIRIDFAHPGPHPGSRKYLDGNVARLHLKSWMLDDIAHDVEPARIYLRGHRHTYRHERAEVYGEPDRVADLFICAPYCGISYHARQYILPQRMVTGILALEIEDGKFTDYRAFKHIRDMRTQEIL